MARVCGSAVITAGIGVGALTLGPVSAANAQALFQEQAVARGVSYLTSFYQAGQSFGPGVAFIDLDNDHDPDFVSVGAASRVVGVYRNDGSGMFDDVSALTGIGLINKASCVTGADYDADGDLDLLITAYCAPTYLFRNDGNFTFTDVTPASGIVNVGPGTGASWGDINGDGWVDLFLANRSPDALCNSPISLNKLYINNADGTFTEAAVARGLVELDAPSFQGGFIDIDRDNDLDLFVAEDKGRIDCPRLHTKHYRNDGGVFTEISAQTGAYTCLDAMCITFGDLNADGYPDVYLTDSGPANVLLLSQGDGTFVESAAAAGVTGTGSVYWGAAFFDAENDGDEDLFVANHNGSSRLFLTDGAWPMQDHAAQAGVDAYAQAFSLAKADIDADGDVDLALGVLNGRIRIYTNQAAETGSKTWCRVRVAGRDHNLFGVGSRIGVRCGERWWWRDVVAGSSFKSQHELIQGFGLDLEETIDEVVVVWPDGHRRTIGDVKVGRTLVVSDNPADLTLDGFVTDGDFFDFIDRYFNGRWHDINNDGYENAQDFFDYVNAYFGS